MRFPYKFLIIASVCVFAAWWWMQGHSDLTILRAEFDVPRGAKVVSCESYPDGWSIFPREGLDIEVVFQLGEEDYAAYLARANASGQWLPLPIPENFLRHMGGISTARASRVRSYKLQNRPLPEEGSIYNPTDDQLLCRFVESLPRIPSQGLFQCRSAGDNIMVTPKMIHTRLDHDLNDFMLGLLDDEKRQLAIKVHTGY